MADTDIKDFDPTTPANNTTLRGITIDQNAMQTAQVDDAFRTMLSVIASADFGTLPILGDTVNESTAAAGVTVDGLLIKDSNIDFGVTGPSADTISESTAAAGVTVDGVLLKDNAVTATATSSFSDIELTGQINSPEQTLTDAANITWNAANGNAAVVTLNVAGATRQLNTPSNIKSGATYILRVFQDGSGSRALTFSGDFEFPNGATPVLSTGGGALDILTFYSNGTRLYGTAQYNFG